MNVQEILITISSKEREVLEALSPYMTKFLEDEDNVEIKNANIEEGVGFELGELVLVILISLATKDAYTILRASVSSAFEKYKKAHPNMAVEDSSIEITKLDKK